MKYDSSWPSICFLLYYSRSGSTYLASKLDQYSDIGVTVESNFIRALILNRTALLAASTSLEVYEKITDEERVRNLGVARDAFCENLRSGGRYTVEEVTYALLASYFQQNKPGCKVWMVKDGANGFWINQLAQEIPTARFLHVVRDGRAVLNSGLNSRRPYFAGEQMARDPATAARLWSRFVERADQYMNAHPTTFLKCRYEDLIANQQEQLTRIRRFLGLLGETTELHSASRFYERLPQQEKGIHQLAAGSAVSERIYAWKHELDKGDLLVFEFKAGEVLDRQGYVPLYNRRWLEMIRDREFIAAYCKSLALHGRSWLWLVHDREKLKRILATKLLHWRDRRA